jgi:chromosome condensin MukBEF ATPase and DNA-binding subunit MukB
MMNDYERTLELVALAEDSVGATQAQQVEYMQSLEASQKRLATAYEALITALVNNDAVKTIIDFMAKVLERFASALSAGDKSAASITRMIGT